LRKSNIEILLGEWGAWKRGENRSVLGYPEKSAFMVMRVDGQRRSEPDAPMVDDDLRRLDTMIGDLFPDARRVMIAHYVWIGVWQDKIKQVGMTKTNYYAYLDSGTRQLAHWMGEKYSIEDLQTIPE